MRPSEQTIPPTRPLRMQRDRAVLDRARRRFGRPRIDLPLWIALVWALGVLALYTKMILETRFLGVLALVQRWLGGG